MPQNRIQQYCDGLVSHDGITMACLLEENGQIIVSAGETKAFDMTSLASLAAGSVAATGGIAKLMNETGFSVLFHEGQNQQLLMQVMAAGSIFVVLFDQRQTLGWVRFQIRTIKHDFEHQISKLFKQYTETASPFEEVSDSEIDALF